MSEWIATRIGDIADINKRSISKKNAFDEIEYIDVSSVEKGRLLGVQMLKLKDAPSRARRIVQNRDILISTVRPNLEHYYFVKECRDNTIASTGYAVITARKVNPYFLYCLLTRKAYTNYLTLIADGHTSTYPAFNPDVIEDTCLPMPQIDVQDKIANILSSLDNKIDLLRRQNKTLENIAQTLFKRWFVEFEFPNEDGRPYKSSGGKMVASELGEIPVGWDDGLLGDVLATVKNPVSKDNRGSYHYYLPIDCIARKTLTLESHEPIENAESSLISFKENDILFGAMRSYFHKVTIAPFDGLTRTTCFVLRPLKEEVYSYGVLLMFQGETIRYSDNHSQGTTIPYAIWENGLMDMPITIPPEQCLSQFNSIVSPMLMKIKTSYFDIETLTKTRDTLLPKLMSGEIRVN